MSFAVWQFHCDDFWQSYDQPTSDQIEAARLAGASTVELSQGIFARGRMSHRSYEVLPSLMLQRNKNTGFCRHIRRLQASLDSAGAGPVDEHAQAATEAESIQGLMKTVSAETLPRNTMCPICYDEFDNEGNQAVTLPACRGHWFHADCVEPWLVEKHKCPFCKHAYGIQRGACPDGLFHIRHHSWKLPGYRARQPPRAPDPVPNTSSILQTNQQQDEVDEDMYWEESSDTSESNYSSTYSAAAMSPDKERSTTEEYSNGTWTLVWSIPSGIQTAGHQNPGQPFRGESRVAYLPDTPEYGIILKMFQIAWKRKLMFTVGHSLTRDVDNVIIWNGIHCRTERDNDRGFGWPCPTYARTVTAEFENYGITPDQDL